MFKAVIFDMDGVLIDSEIVYITNIHRYFSATYPQLTLEDLYPSVGMNATEDKPFFASLLGRDPTDPAFLEELHQAYVSANIYYPDILRPQVPGLLKSLKDKGLQVALASSSSPQNIDRVLTQCNIKGCFDHIISGYQFKRSKPDPEIYLYTMAQLGRKPEECLIVEDSTYGIEAGAAAGVAVAALRDDRFPFDQSKAKYHIDTLDEILALVEKA